MGGREAIRGFGIQTLVALLDAIEIDHDWISVTIEPDSSNDKVDILWRYANRTRFVQVKSSKNVIGKSEVHGWTSELKNSGRADAYELKLSGPVAAGVFNVNTFNGVDVPTPSSISLMDLVEQAITKLDRYLTRRDIDAVPLSIREELVNICASRLLNGSSTGHEVSRQEFDGWLLHWVAASYPQALSTRLASNCEVLWGSYDLLPPTPGSRAFTLGLPVTVFNAGRSAAIVEWLVVQVSSEFARMIYAPSQMVVLGSNRPFSKFVVGPGQSVEVNIRMIAQSKPGYSSDAWVIGLNCLQVFVKFSNASVPRSVGEAKLTVTGDHMKLLNGEGVFSYPVSSLGEYIEGL